ncbi:hypothetical protein LZ31DRAFT_378124 [Colletotrichum somersetense]|nr:hypothetical protein LZ31DRAFT_378124 [Colletotrichum somersetense]
MMTRRSCLLFRSRQPLIASERARRSRLFCLAARDSACFSLTRARTVACFLLFFLPSIVLSCLDCHFLPLPVSLLGDAFSYTRENKYPITTTSHTYVHGRIG